MNDIPQTPDGRDEGGLFQPGNTVGNSGGRPRGMGPARRLEQLIQAEGASLFELAFERARHDDNVLAAVITLVGAAEMSSAVQQFKLLQASAQGSH